MMDGKEQAARYRCRAEELRTIAQDWVDADVMMTLAMLAWRYEKMADDMERVARLDGSGQ